MVWKNPDKYDFLAITIEDEENALNSIEKIKENIKKDKSENEKESEDDLKNVLDENC